MHFFRKHKKIFFNLIAFTLIVVGVGFLSRSANALSMPNWLEGSFSEVLGRLVQLLVWVGGQILAVLMWVMFYVARYNNFIGSPAVVNGWYVVRDLCNIFFVVIFLVMCVATVLDIESYAYTRILTKLLIMVVLINFSKAICGLFIDISQIVMMTFMNSFGKLGAGYLTNILGLQSLLDQANAATLNGVEIDFWSIAGTYMMVLIYVIVAIGAILVITLVLVQRIVMLWIYVVLSPFAYLLSTFPSGTSYAGKWWNEFTKYVTIGPIVALFIWLSFVTLGGLNANKTLPDLPSPEEEAAVLEAGTTGANTADSSAPQAGLTEAGSPSHMLKFIIAIAMLLGGLMVAQTIGGMAGSFAGTTISGLGAMGVAAVDWVNRKQAGGLTGKGWNTKTMGWTGKENWFGAKKGLAMLGNVVARGSGQDLNWKRRAAVFKEGMARSAKKDIRQIGDRAGELSSMRGLAGYALGTGSRDWWDQRVKGFLGLNGFAQAAWTTFKPAEKYGEEAGMARETMKKLKESKKDVLTSQEYHALTEPETAKIRESVNVKDEALTKKRELGREMGNLKANIKRAHDLGNHDHEESLTKELEAKQKEFEENEVRLKEADKIKKEAWEKINEYKQRKQDGKIEIVANKEAKEKRMGEIDEEIAKHQKVYQAASDKQAKLVTYNPEAQKARRAAQGEAEKNLLSDDSAELIAMFKNALINGERDIACAILKRLAKNVDTNEILEAYGYNTKSGLSKEELEKLRKEGNLKAIEQNKGYHAFLRDTLVKQLGMGEQLVYALEAELGGIHKGTANQEAYSELVKIENGKYRQATMQEQAEAAYVDLNKQDMETVARKGSRFAFGGEDINGDFRVHACGLNFILSKFELLGKEIERGRLNPWNALKLTEGTNMAILRAAAKTLSEEQRKGYEKFLDQLEVYGKSLRGATGDMSKNIASAASVINNNSHKSNA